MQYHCHAAIALCSPAHFIRTFSATFGETPIRYLQRRRIERAMALLRTTDLPVQDVCTAVGWSSLATFTRRFREVTGWAPRVSVPEGIEKLYGWLRENRVQAAEPLAAGKESA